MTPLPAGQAAMTLRKAAGRVEGLAKTLESACGAAAATPPPREVWERGAGELEEGSACMGTAQQPRTVT